MCYFEKIFAYNIPTSHQNSGVIPLGLLIHHLQKSNWDLIRAQEPLALPNHQLP